MPARATGAVAALLQAHPAQLAARDEYNLLNSFVVEPTWLIEDLLCIQGYLTPVP